MTAVPTFVPFSDPYAQIELGNQSHKTKVMENQLNREWNETFSGLIGSNHDVLTVTIMDYDMVKSDDLLGMVEIPVSNLKIGETYHQWYLLESPELIESRKSKKGSGEVQKDKSDFENSIQVRTIPDGTNVGRKYYFKTADKSTCDKVLQQLRGLIKIAIKRMDRRSSWKRFCDRCKVVYDSERYQAVVTTLLLSNFFLTICEAEFTLVGNSDNGPGTRSTRSIRLSCCSTWCLS